ncbi:uncharacterized protein TRUGW13939_00287 [Talaromyces rugulosus]|uniref:4-hydroxybenzoate polyprenyl transferase n=1 Tax=Talaromyces rugulosus TaxID=121627 RepID=A0A7H8QI96_TALRU|nr:uncharacterized protein TRUGW13939_00287 [Talaromyces rugulosus]QKX53211.1 hypothetical protein TRUGW13939_00287 [Talaromyces rugulosus]
MPSKKANKAAASAPKYSPPTSGILSYFPSSWVPYAELIRLEKPHGIYMIWYPYIMGLLYSARISENTLSLELLCKRALDLTIWTFILRSTGCAWNDNVDQDYDRKTARCCNRPIARGAISTVQGHIYVAALTGLGFTSIQHFPVECTFDACAILLLAAIYPFGKRFTHFAQVPLGATLSGAIVMAQHSVGIDPLSNENLRPTACLVVSIILLVVFYDVVYARQDTVDDLKSGVKGMAVLFRNWIKTLLLSLVSGIAALLFLAGKFADMRRAFFYSSVGGTALGLLTMIMVINTSQVARYAGRFYILAIGCLLGGFAVECYDKYEAVFTW